MRLAGTKQSLDGMGVPEAAGATRAGPASPSPDPAPVHAAVRPTQPLSSWLGEGARARQWPLPVVHARGVPAARERQSMGRCVHGVLCVRAIGRGRAGSGPRRAERAGWVLAAAAGVQVAVRLRTVAMRARGWARPWTSSTESSTPRAAALHARNAARASPRTHCRWPSSCRCGRAAQLLRSRARCSSGRSPGRPPWAASSGRFCPLLMGRRARE